jgi:hypothetical protein
VTTLNLSGIEVLILRKMIVTVRVETELWIPRRSMRRAVKEARN